MMSAIATPLSNRASAVTICAIPDGKDANYVRLQEQQPLD
jgi:hypothetical protein